MNHKIWEAVFSSRDWGKYPPEELIRFIAHNYYTAPSRRDIKILEVGCGTGANLWFCAREGFCVSGVDCSPSAIRKARQRLDAECPGWTGKLVVADIASLDFEDGYFDAVIDLEAICCNAFEASVQIYGECTRVLKKGGRLFSRTFADGSWGDGTGEKLAEDLYMCSEGPAAGIGYCRFTKKEAIPRLIGTLALENVEMVTRTCDNQAHIIKEWVITARKD